MKRFCSLVLTLVLVAGCTTVKAQKRKMLDERGRRHRDLVLQLASLPDPGPPLFESLEERTERLLLGLDRIAVSYTRDEIRDVLSDLGNSDSWNPDIAMDAKVFLLCRVLFAVPSCKALGTTNLWTAPHWSACEPLAVGSDGKLKLDAPVVVFPWFSGPKFDYIEHFDRLREAFGERDR